MTAAVVSSTSFCPVPPPGRQNPLVPYLAPVPDCEPPFDDEVGVRPRTSARRPPVTVGDRGRADATAGRAELNAVLGGPQQADADPGSGAHPSAGAGTDANDGTGSDAGTGAEPERAKGFDRPDPAGRQIRASRRRQSELNRTVKSAVQLLDAGQPRTITSAGVPSWSSEADIGVRKTASEHLPPVGKAASVLARALVEVLSGQRPLAQLRVHCAPEIYAGLGERPATAPTALPHLLGVRVCEPADGVAEVSAAFRRADRVRALAFRVEGVDGRWRITALQLG